MDNWEELRTQLIKFVTMKFYTRTQISQMAEDIVNEAFADVLPNKDKCNFGYLSKVCIHKAYRMFKKLDSDNKLFQSIDVMFDLVDEKDVVEEIIQNENVEEILASLEVLKQMERIIVVQRYYGDYSFAEIANKNGIKLNTVLSHHRRALEKLRSHLVMWEPRKLRTEDKIRTSQKSNFSSLF